MVSITLQDPLTVDEVSSEYRVSQESVRRWIRQKRLKATRFGERGDYRIYRQDLERFLQRTGRGD